MGAQPVAVLGGCFDPIHIGHLAVAQAAAEQLPAERVLIVPNGQPAHRAQPVADYLDRVAMAADAVQGLPAGRIPIEVAELEPPGEDRYTIDTVAALAKEGKHAILLVGADAFADLQSWRSWQELLKRASFAVACRPGAQAAEDAIAHACADDAQLASGPAELAEHPCVWAWPLDTPDCSSSSVRSKYAAGDTTYELSLPAEVWRKFRNAYAHPMHSS